MSLFQVKIENLPGREKSIWNNSEYRTLHIILQWILEP